MGSGQQEAGQERPAGLAGGVLERHAGGVGCLLQVSPCLGSPFLKLRSHGTPGRGLFRVAMETISHTEQMHTESPG